MNEALFQDIQTFLSLERETSEETKEYEQLLEAFNQVPSYVERFKQREEPDHSV